MTVLVAKVTAVPAWTANFSRTKSRSDFGEELGMADRIDEGEALGEELGLMDGLAVGEALGVELGLTDGLAEGEALGVELGLTDGFAEGDALGEELGLADGLTEGEALGEELGLADGLAGEDDAHNPCKRRDDPRKRRRSAPIASAMRLPVGEIDVL
jgi:hypothetical protein